MLDVTDAQRGRTFTQITPSVIWSRRIRANVEWINVGRIVSYVDYANEARRTVTFPANTGYFLLVGGESDEGYQNDVWVSSNARTWAFVSGFSDGLEHPDNGDKSFTPAGQVAHCQDRLFRQYRAGGEQGGVLNSEVWMSSDLGKTWNMQTAYANWEPRFLASMVSDQNNNLYIAGGILRTGPNPRLDSNEVWRSATQGRTWTLMQSRSYLASGQGPVGRGVAVLLTSGSIWGSQEVMIWLTGVDPNYGPGDDPRSYLKDVWASRNGGSTWEVINLDAAFGTRDDANAEITSGGLIVLAGGYAGTGARSDNPILNDVWVSANGSAIINRHIYMDIMLL